jgi:hypothetical protein
MQNRSQLLSPLHLNFHRYLFVSNMLDWLDRLVHNHPSGDPSPSQADVKMTLEIIAVAGPLGVAVHDHLIVGRQGHASLRSLRLI